MLSTNEAEKRKLSDYYGDKMNSLARSIRFIKDNAQAAKDQERRGQLQSKLTNAYRSKLHGLYANLKKNADSVVKLGPTVFPDISCSYDDASKQYSFTNCPNFSRLFNDYHKSIGTLADAKKTLEIPDSKNGTRLVTPCLSTQKEGTTMTAFLKSKRPSDDLRAMPLLDLTGVGGIQQCTQEHCLDCTDCAPHIDQLRDSLNGITSLDPNTGDGMRSLHMKNLITTLNSFAAHMDTRGRDRDSQAEAKYLRDSYDHNLLGSAMRLMAHRLNLAYEDDRKAKPGMGGGIHRDNFGIGDNPRVY